MKLEPLFKYDLKGIVTMLERGYSGFPVSTTFSETRLLNQIRLDGLDLSCSRLVRDREEVVALALIARRGWRCYLADMAVVPEARRSGIGQWLINQMISEAKARGEKTMALEVMELNNAAFRLYESVGFRTVRRLVGYTGFQATEGKTDAVEEVDLLEVAQKVSAFGLGNLPWQISAESLTQLGSPDKGYRLDSAYMAVSDPKASRIVLRSVVVESQARGKGQASRLLCAIMKRHGVKEWEVPALCPEEFGQLFEKAGFIQSSLGQFQMIFHLA